MKLRLPKVTGDFGTIKKMVYMKFLFGKEMDAINQI